MTQQNLLWTVLLVGGGAFLVLRVATGELGKAYVQEQTVFASGEGDDAKVDVVIGPATDENVAAHPNAERWTRYALTDPTARNEPTVSFSWAHTLGIWLAAFLTLAIFSFLFGDNPLYRLAESIFIGVSAAYAMVVGFWTGVVQNLIGKLAPFAVKEYLVPGLKLEKDVPKHLKEEVLEEWAAYQANDLGYWQAGWPAVDWIYLVPLVFGVMLLMRLSPVGGWISRWPLAFFIGATAGIRLIGFFEADFVRQIQATLLPLIAFQSNGSFDLGKSLAHVTIVVGVLSSLAYFFFSVEHTGAFGAVSRVGIWFLMITFGASFGYTVMGRIALFAQRLEFLFDDWLWVIDPLGRRAGL